MGRSVISRRITNLASGGDLSGLHADTARGGGHVSTAAGDADEHDLVQPVAGVLCGEPVDLPEEQVLLDGEHPAAVDRLVRRPVPTLGGAVRVDPGDHDATGSACSIQCCGTLSATAIFLRSSGLRFSVRRPAVMSHT